MNIFGRNLTLQMAIATLLGLLCGLFFGELCSHLAPWANAYIMILKVTAIPYLIIAIMHGIGQMSYIDGKQILKKGILFIVLAWILNMGIIYLMAFLFPHSDLQQSGGALPSQAPPINFAELLIPDNIFYALSNNVIPAVVIFSLFIGLALMHIPEKQTCMSLLEIGIDTLTRITRWISKITPYGTFLIIANQAGTIHFTTIQQIGTYILLYILGATLLIFWIFPRLVSMLTPIPAMKWIRDLTPILILAYTTNTVLVCLPYIIQLVQKESKSLLPSDRQVTLPTQGVVSVIFNLPLASLFISLFVLFISTFYQIPLSLTGHLELFFTTFLTGLGAIGIGSWINSLSFLLESLGLPLEGIKLYLTTIPFTAGFQSMISTMEITSLSLIIILVYRNAIHCKWQTILKKASLTIAPILLLVIGLNTWNFLPKIKNNAIQIEDLAISSPVNIKIYTDNELPPVRAHLGEETLASILETKTLRVGYYPCIPPFCFFNRNGQPVGYDMAFATQLANDLGVNLELVPLNYARLEEELNEGFYDIGMSAISLTETRLKSLCFSKSYAQGQLVWVVPEGEKKRYIKNPLKKGLKIAALKGSSFEHIARTHFPDQQMLPLSDYEELTAIKGPIALLWEEQEAISWVLSHPGYTLIFPKTALGVDSFAYPIRACDTRFLNYINQWLDLKVNEGFAESQYQLWILRNPNSQNGKERRWSILHDLLNVSFR